MRYLYIVCVLLMQNLAAYKLGIDQFSPQDLRVLGYKPDARIALVTNQTGMNSIGKSTLDILRAHRLTVSCLCAPEHGVDGKIQAGIPVADSTQKKTRIPIISLYGHGRKDLTPDFFDTFDLFVFHLQDAGMRHYTHVATLLYVLELASIHNKGCIVLDRPNPLGHIMEGPVIEKPMVKNGVASFLGSVPLPLRHGMTIGEIALFLNKHVLKKSIPLHVVCLCDYERTMHVKPHDCKTLSPNIQSKKACMGYSFLGLLGEVRPFDVGIATDHAFCRFGLPHSVADKQQWIALKNSLHKKGVISEYSAYKRKDVTHHGLTIRAFDPLKSSSCTLFCDIIAHFKKCGVTCSFSDHFDTAAGSELLQNLAQGLVKKESGVATLSQQLKQFYTKAQSCFLYKPYPQMLVP